jgi:6-phosphogluconolactonase (cycloisomerase 2 family)
MCADRCFSNSNESNSASDHTRTTKQKTIFRDVINQVQTQNNFIKSNGVNYNENFGLHNNCLSFAKSYDLLLDVTKGKYYTTPIEDPNWVSNESWSAGLYSVDYSANNVNVVVDTSYNAGNGNHIIFPMTQPAELADISWNGLYPGVRVDPSYNIFYNECNHQNYWREKLVNMNFNNTNYYKQSKQNSEKLYGIGYPGNVTFSCGIKYFAYVANTDSDSVSAYIINSTTGALMNKTDYATGSEPISVIVDPNGKFAYVANSGSAGIAGVSAYIINSTTGALTNKTDYDTGSQPYSVTVDPTGNFVYVANYGSGGSGGVSAYIINSTTGALTNKTDYTTGSQPYSVTVDPTGKFAYVANNGSDSVSAYMINSTTGALTNKTDYATDVEPYSVTVDPTGKFAYVANNGSDSVSAYIIDSTTGALTNKTDYATGVEPVSVTVDPTGKFAYVANYNTTGSAGVSAYMIDSTTGALMNKTDYATGSNPVSVTVDPTGKFAYVANSESDTVSAYMINSTTGALTNKTDYSSGIFPASVITSYRKTI